MAVQYPYRDLSLPEVLQETLADLERYGWKPNTWNVAGPMNIRCALWHVINTTPSSKRDDMSREALTALGRALGHPLGGIIDWEYGRDVKRGGEKVHLDRTFDDVKALFARAIQLVSEQAA